MATADQHFRRFNVIDGMIIIAGVAATLALAKFTIPALADFLRALYSLRHELSPKWRSLCINTARVMATERNVWFDTELHFVIIFIAFAVLRLRHPRPSFAVVSLQPGSVACCAASATFAIALAHVIIDGNPSDGPFVRTVMCLAVPVAWGTLKVSGRWQPEASWIDRFGRTLGFSWWTVSWLRVLFLIHMNYAYEPYMITEEEWLRR